MTWQDLLVKDDTVTVPWTGGRDVHASGRSFRIRGQLPAAHGWHAFRVTGGRDASWIGPAEVDVEALFPKKSLVRGYVVDGRLIPDQVRPALSIRDIMEQTELVRLLEPGLARFTRVRAGRWEDGRLIYLGQEFPLGPEDVVTEAYQDNKASVSHIPRVTPALHLAFRLETWNRAEKTRAREEAERLAREEQARLIREEARSNLIRQLGDGEGRRRMAAVDFEAAARAALRVGGAELLDWRDSHTAGEVVVQFRYRERRFECVAQKTTLRIVEAGICLVDSQTQERGDTRFTLESLPGVIGLAIDTGRLHVFRRLDGEDHDDD